MRYLINANIASHFAYALINQYPVSVYVYIYTHESIIITQYGSTVYIGMALVWPAL